MSVDASRLLADHLLGSLPRLLPFLLRLLAAGDGMFLMLQVPADNPPQISPKTSKAFQKLAACSLTEAGQIMLLVGRPSTPATG